MANLALVVGVPFLIEPATKLLQKSQGKWLNKEVPENLSYECARFLLSGPKGVALNDEEVQVYEGMKRYKESRPRILIQRCPDNNYLH
jgi:hypothetical protein